MKSIILYYFSIDSIYILEENIILYFQSIEIEYYNIRNKLNSTYKLIIIQLVNKLKNY